MNVRHYLPIKLTWSCFCVIAVLSMAACHPVTEDDQAGNANNQLEPAVTIPAAIAAQSVSPDDTPTPQPTFTPPPLPTAKPTSPIVYALTQVGGEASGLQFAVPSSWQNWSGRLDVPRATNPLGLIVLLVTDSERTGESLLAGKSLVQGAFVTGHIAHLDLPPDVPMAGLSAVLADLPDNLQVLADVTPVTAVPPGASSGAYVDVLGDPLGFFGSKGGNMRTRIYLFFPADAATAVNSQAFFLFSAPADQWHNYETTFEEIASTFALHNIEDGFAITGGEANVQQEISSQQLVHGRLQRNRTDVWTFRTESGRYATINLKPDGDNIDLVLKVISPSGSTVTQIDNGFTSDAEVATDLFLAETGLYVIEISEFFNAPGRYSLSLVLTDNPLFSSGGRIYFGQGIQSDLPANQQQVWRFNGSAGQIISIVMTPISENLDGILEFYDPEGRQLLSLDEGFSGDPEVVNGFELPVTGEYAIVIRSFAGNSGAYALSLDEGGEETLNFHDAGDLAYGSAKRETLQPNEAHAWFFNGSQGDVVQIEVTPLSQRLDPEVWLLDPDAQRLTTQDAFLEGEPETVNYTLPRDGQYIVLVRDFHGESGDYEVRLLADPVATPTFGGNLAYGDSVSGMFGPGQVTLWQFQGRAGDFVSVQVSPSSPNVDLILMLEDPNGIPVRIVDEGVVDEDEVLADFRLTEDGFWRIVVREFFGEGGSYSLTLDRAR